MARVKKVEAVSPDDLVDIPMPGVVLIETKPPEALADYIAAREAQKLDTGVVLVKVSHPEADSRVFPGRYSGIVIEQGSAGCVWSDGSTE